MKKIALILLVGAIGCGHDPEPSFKYSYSITNNAGFDVQLSCTGCQQFTIKDKETQVVNTDTEIAMYQVSATISTVKKTYLDEVDKKTFTVVSYEFDVIYKVEGDAQSVNITVKNSAGQTQQFNNLILPQTYEYRDFEGHDLFVSATNNTTHGTVRVKVFLKEKLLDLGVTTLSNGTATATGTK